MAKRQKTQEAGPHLLPAPPVRFFRTLYYFTVQKKIILLTGAE